jgi:hypothetical protein
MESKNHHSVLNSEQIFPEYVFSFRRALYPIFPESTNPGRIAHHPVASQYFMPKGLPLFTTPQHPLF